MGNKVIILTTGGTIAMQETGRGAIPVEGDIVSPVIGQLSGVDVEVDNYLNLPSPHITPQLMLDLARRTAGYLARSDVAGVVVTHGTDTLEETAYFFDLWLSGPKPVVFTGAMRSSNEISPDGPINLLDSVKVAAEPESRGKGVLVVFNEEIHAARYVTKTHTSNVATFQSPRYGPIGSVNKYEVVYTRTPIPTPHYPVETIDARVDLIKIAAGMDDRLIQAALDFGTKGLVVEALGQGNVPPAVLPGIREAIARNIPVVVVSRCYSGNVHEAYGYEGGGRQLKEMGVIFGYDLNGQKARIKLMVGLVACPDMDCLRRMFAK